MTKTASDIAAEFPPVSREGWAELASGSLKGKPLESLTRYTRDAIARGPLFSREDLPGEAAIGAPGAAPFTRGAAGVRDRFLPWDIRTSIPAGPAMTANTALIGALQGGASSILLPLDPAGDNGAAARNLHELNQLLDGMRQDMAAVWLEDGTVSSAALLAATWDDLKPGGIGGGFGLSPIASAARRGAKEGDESPLTGAALWAAEHAPKVRAGAVRADLAHEAGGTSAQEIAWMAAEGASYMRALIAAGLTADQAASTLELRLAADGDFHKSISTLRAARRVWTRVAGAFGVSEHRQAGHIHAVTSRRMMSGQDAWTNLLRTTAAAFAAAIGGADAITVRPIAKLDGHSSAFARRMARNIQVMLAEETHAGRVADPAGGGYLHEHLTHATAAAAWKMFQTIEGKGGLRAALVSGWVQAEIAKAREKQMHAYEQGETLIGVNQYKSGFPEPPAPETQIIPDPPDGEPIPDKNFDSALKAARAGGVLPPREPGKTEIMPLTPMRWADDFEGDE